MNMREHLKAIREALRGEHGHVILSDTEAAVDAALAEAERVDADYQRAERYTRRLSEEVLHLRKELQRVLVEDATDATADYQRARGAWLSCEYVDETDNNVALEMDKQDWHSVCSYFNPSRDAAESRQNDGNDRRAPTANDRAVERIKELTSFGSVQMDKFGPGAGSMALWVLNIIREEEARNG